MQKSIRPSGIILSTEIPSIPLLEIKSSDTVSKVPDSSLIYEWDHWEELFPTCFQHQNLQSPQKDSLSGLAPQIATDLEDKFQLARESLEFSHLEIQELDGQNFQGPSCQWAGNSAKKITHFQFHSELFIPETEDFFAIYQWEKNQHFNQSLAINQTCLIHKSLPLWNAYWVKSGKAKLIRWIFECA